MIDITYLDDSGNPIVEEIKTKEKPIITAVPVTIQKFQEKNWLRRSGRGLRPAFIEDF